MWTPVTIGAVAVSGFISFTLILSLWLRHRRDGVLKRFLWSILLLVPVIGWVLYGGLYEPPPVQPEDMRARETPGTG